MDAKIYIQGPLVRVPIISLEQEGRKEEGLVGEEEKSEREGGMKERKKGMKEEKKKGRKKERKEGRQIVSPLSHLV